MGAWVLEYQVSHPRDAIPFDAVWAVHELGNARMREGLERVQRSLSTLRMVGYGSELHPDGGPAPASDAWKSSRSWVGYYLLHGPPDEGLEAVAWEIRDRVREACLRAGWEWRGEAEAWTPSEDQLRPLTERFPRAEPWAYADLADLLYQPPWRRAKPSAAADGGREPGSS
jgi:hypothetical protein